jgi:hypothetical protein
MQIAKQIDPYPLTATCGYLNFKKPWLVPKKKACPVV